MSIEKEGFLSKEIEQWVQKHRKENDKLFFLCNEINLLAQSQLRDLKINSEDIQKIISSGLFVRILSQYQSIIVLTEKGIINEAKIILRVMLDSLFILGALVRDTKYTDYYINDDIEKRIESLKRFSKNNDNHFDDIRQLFSEKSIDIDIELKELSKKKKDLEHKGLKYKDRISTKKWAELAKMEALYYRLYSQFNYAVHGLSRELEQYVSVNENGEISMLNWGPDIEGIDIILTTSADFLCRALTSINALFEFDNSKVEGFWKIINEFEIVSQKMEIKSIK